MKSIKSILATPTQSSPFSSKRFDNNIYQVYIIQAYERKLENGDVIDVCELQLIDTSVDNAIKRAEKIIKKPFYRVRMIVENFRKKE